MKILADYVVSIPDFPQPGILFRDVTTVVQDAEGLRLAIDTMQNLAEGLDFDAIVGAESRGFLFGMPMAYNLKKPFVLIRKKGKLPRATVSAEYDLEYGKGVLEMHKDALRPGDRALLVDDLLATGGTIGAMIQLVEQCGATVAGIVVLMELKGLNGRERIGNYVLRSAIQYEGT